MTLHHIHFEVLLSNFFDFVRQLADYELQKKAWIEGDYSSDMQTYCELILKFDDAMTSISNFMHARLSETVIAEIESLQMQLNSFTESRPDWYARGPHIDSSEWLAVVEAARSLVEAWDIRYSE